MTPVGDGRLEVTNTYSERLVKELIMGRKNCFFSNSLEEARLRAIS
ncbi:IS66 family transposase [Enterococcus sp. BWT-B8]|nr:IS66 family transposase [Enterococcus sp. BWT-B8]MCB5953832.1 IS66 family transposase [Enterococcus sp. CWB-B31]